MCSVIQLMRCADQEVILELRSVYLYRSALLLANMVQFSETNIAALTLSCATLSLICCSVVALSIRLDPRGAKSYHLILVQSLLRADIGLSLCIITYFSLQYYVSGHSLDLVCRGYLPFVVYFFLVSSGWTVMLALRFRSSQNVAAQFNKPPIPMWAVWAIPLLPAIAILVVSYSVHDVAYARSNSNETNQSCQFDHSSAAGILVDIVCFQAPLIVITFANIYMYARGLSSLHNAPHSVIARQMKRAGGYLAVLLIVWFPNIGYNLLVTCDSTDEQYDNFLVLTIILQASQVSTSFLPSPSFHHSYPQRKTSNCKFYYKLYNFFLGFS